MFSRGIPAKARVVPTHSTAKKATGPVAKKAAAPQLKKPKVYTIFYDQEQHRVLTGSGGRESLAGDARVATASYFPGGTMTGKGRMEKHICTGARVEIAQEVGEELAMVFDLFKDSAAIFSFTFANGRDGYFIICFVNRHIMDFISRPARLTSAHESRFTAISAQTIAQAEHGFTTGGVKTNWFPVGLAMLPIVNGVPMPGGVTQRATVRGRPSDHLINTAIEACTDKIQYWDLFGFD